ncbi:MAG: lipopolysaccharide biosynthesis protein RfbH [Omnitrophica WOR_2 bacterium RIFCSPHIGHO2_01_FULL_48_9]|nr:MAG: lipopolysaccharide biosynthesis protein RfbH [Omnitrophica WOR_2 bacterium RIFCSPHIGHO2_02_FULL_48_11]OGX31476.1 MAG: lipopolysaccharide biosynthesis protein RfbH [Omnitrophica WOR_2 bacterium RIFCSPHIGHO2_01_FULL_48_9]
MTEKEQNSKEQALRKEIFAKVKDLYQLKHKASGFIPGESVVPYAGRVYDEEDMISLMDASLDFWLTAGRFAQEFEKSLSEYLGRRACLLTNSGSSANLLAVAALTSPALEDRQLKPGDEIITVACGFPTTVNPILQNQCVPVFVDVDLGTYNVSVEKLEQAISPKTKAIILAHTLGNPADLAKILALVKKHKLWFIEDCCDALGSKYQGKYVGTFGDMATCSFYPAHHITMGEGGAVLTDDLKLKKILASFRDWGRDCWCDPGQSNTCGKRFAWQLGDLPYGYDHKYIYSHIGYNLKATDMQAAVGVSQLKKLDRFTVLRKNNFQRLYQHLKPYENYFLLPQWDKDSDPNWFGFPLLVKETAPFGRDEIVQYLEERKIATRMLFGGNLLKQPAYKNRPHRVASALKNTETVMQDLFWIGVYPGLTEEHLDYVCRTFKEFLKNGKFEKRVHEDDIRHIRST